MACMQSAHCRYEAEALPLIPDGLGEAGQLIDCS